MESSKILAIVLLLLPILMSNASTTTTTPILESKCGGPCPNPYPKPPIYEPPVTVPTLPLPPIVIPTLPIPPVTIPTIPILNPPEKGNPYPYPYPPKKGKPYTYPHPPKKGKPCPSPPGKAAATCPIDTLKLGACVDLLGGLVHIGLGDPAVNECCPVLEGLVELEAAVCLCTTLKIRALNLNMYVPLALQLLITCGKTPPPGYTCSL